MEERRPAWRDKTFWLLFLGLALLVGLTIANHFRDVQVDGISIEDRRRLHDHDAEQDAERQMLQRQLNAQAVKIEQLAKEVEELKGKQ